MNDWRTAFAIITKKRQFPLKMEIQVLAALFSGTFCLWVKYWQIYTENGGGLHELSKL